ncbi:galactose oxidase early set domain-containing protein [Pilimelia columellifera]
MAGLTLGLLCLTLALAEGVPPPASSAPPSNLVVNPGVEELDDGRPACWQLYQRGANTAALVSTSDEHSGRRGMTLRVTAYTDGDAKAMMAERAGCAPAVTPGLRYDLSVWYRSNAPGGSITLFRHDGAGWHYWTDLANLPAAATYTEATARTPVVPAGTTRIQWGVSLAGAGVVTTDDYRMKEAGKPPANPICAPGERCPSGAWEVMPYQSPVRGIHAAVLRTGKVLLIAGSGNDPGEFAKGQFSTTLYDPEAGSFTPVPTPDDLFCGGHAQLPDGRLLVLGGNASYPAADGSHGYKGLRASYIFDPETNAYTRMNDMNEGHWYPSATVLGNGDVLSVGGLNERSEGAVGTEYFSSTQRRWLAPNEVTQTYRFWGLYPAMILTADGRLFYSGSHVFGDGLPGAGASLYDHTTGKITDVPGLQDKDRRDQSMSVLLPPAQDQRVLTVGGGNVVSNLDAVRHTDVVDLSANRPRYRAGPKLPTGFREDGARQKAHEGKMYVSTVILPDGKVFETGGAVHNRADPVFEASMYNPETNRFTDGMARDPVPRGYHSSAFLLPDGRVMAVGDNPGDGSFDNRISVYSPWYLFEKNRPAITSVASRTWKVGSTQRLTVEGDIAEVALIRPAAVTHSSDPNQRYVRLPIVDDDDDGNIDVALTPNPNLAPPGWYMLYAADKRGVPSAAQWVRIEAPATRVPPARRDAAPRPRAVTVPAGVDGCVRSYGDGSQCVPRTFPSMVVDRCGYLRERGLTSLPVRAGDPHALDRNRDGVACGQGD